jgi:two-component system cell cycle sensor histidine kinase PleC
MSQEEIEVALAPFGQIHNDKQNTSVGTGLGLPLVNRFITLIGGNMTIRSAPGHGTSIKLEIPKALSTKISSNNLAPELLY